jgi:Sap, sulfolipid-1-addressing protein
MGQAIGQTLAYGVGVALSPIAIVGVVLMLSTPRGRSTGPAYLAGWVVALLAVGAVFLLVSGAAGADEGRGEADWVDVLKLVLGLALVVAAFRRGRARLRGGGESREMPGWMRSVDRFTPGRAAATGAALVAVNPKNLALVLAAAAAIAETGASTGGRAVALIVFALVGSLGTGLPVILYLVEGERARDRLDGLRDWMARNNAVVIAVLCLVIGAKLIGDGIAGLTA